MKRIQDEGFCYLSFEPSNPVDALAPSNGMSTNRSENGKIFILMPQERLRTDLVQLRSIKPHKG